VVDPDASAPCPYGACVFGYQVWVMRADGERARMLGEGESAVWSPDGRRLVIEDPWADIYTIRADGTRRRQLTHLEDVRHPVWSPDGRQLAFVHYTLADDPDKAYELYLINADGSGQRRLTRLPGDEPAWSPTGPIAFTVFDALYTINPDGHKLKKLFSGSSIGSYADSAPIAWSPDGTRIAVATEGGIAVVTATGRLVVRPEKHVPDDPLEVRGYPSWSPDGSRILFESGRGIETVDADGSNRTLLAENTDAQQPAWSPDGKRIAFAADDIYIMNADGTALGRLTPKLSAD
jgi:TolB protein